MKQTFKRLTSVILTLAMVITLLPTAVFAAPSGSLADISEDSTPDNGVELIKSVSYDAATGKVTTTIEAYTTGKVTSSSTTKPTDIILVLDTSGSMAYSFAGSDNDSNERINSLKSAVENFIIKTAENNKDADDKHSIAVVTFASNANVLADFTTVDVDTSGNPDTATAALINSVKGLNANGATAVDYGLTEASELLTDRAAEDNGAYAEREKVVIVFTDGDPTHSSNYDTVVAHDAVNAALLIKSTGATVYTIGIFNGADPDGTDRSNIFMSYVSSNYPNAYGYTETEYITVPIFGQIPTGTSYKVAAGAEPHNTGYYLTADNATALNNIFETISSQIGKPDIELGSSATLVDVVSDYFTIDGIGTSNPNITVQTADYLPDGTWDTPKDDSNITVTLQGSDTIEVAGFDFDENYISDIGRNGFFGKKLILTFVTTPDYAAIDATQFNGTEIPTNDTAALLDSQGNAVDYVPSPSLTANKVTYITITDGNEESETYLRFPGAEKTLIDKPEDTDTHTYTDWDTDDVHIPTGDTEFIMPNGDVVFVSEGESKSYTVTFIYRGNVPAGAIPATDPGESTHSVGDDVSVPEVTAPAGYAFSGWIEDDGDVIIADGQTEFTMPAENLHFIGTFSALDNTYKVVHHMMGTDGSYTSETATTHTNTYEGVKTGDSVSATIPDHTGFTYDETTTAANNDSMTTDAVPAPTGTVLANGALELHVYYKRNQHKVTYVYEGSIIPDGVDPTKDELDDIEVTAYYGQTVTLETVTTPDGYSFSEWRIHTGDTAIVGGKMEMPDSDVVLHGSFTANGDTRYTVTHYFEELDGAYNPRKPENKTGETGTTVFAEPLSGTDIVGFYYDETKTGTSNTGTITGDGKLNLKLYYSRESHNVLYEYTGNVPATASPAADAAGLVDKTAYKYGTKIYVKDAATADGFTFVGWNITGTGIIFETDEDGKYFTMPAREVVFTGHFNHIQTKYTVQHWLENADDDGYTMVTPATEYSDDVYAATTVTAVPNTYSEYTYSEDKTRDENPGLTVTASGASGTVLADGSLVIKLYYTRNVYDITYRFENNPENVTLPNGHDDVKTGASVDLADIDEPDGYTFDGWYYGNTKVGDRLTMPAHDVELTGKFIPASGVSYAVEYYLQNLDGTGYEKSNESYTRTGTTGEYVVADTKTFPGFSFNVNAEGTKWNGHIEGDGSLTLKLYYDRNSYKVTYYYVGTPPTGIYMGSTAVTPTADTGIVYEETVKFGTPMTVKPHLTADAKYEFVGWRTANLPGISAFTDVAGGTAYTMPAHNMEFRGALYNYTVYYDLKGGTLNDADSIDPKEVNWNDADLLPNGTPVKDGMIFSGWTNDKLAEGTYVNDSHKYSDLAHTFDDEAIILVAEYANGYRVSYNWGTVNVPTGVTLPTNPNLYKDGDSYTVDTTFTSSTVITVKDAYGNVTGKYKFSGWTDPNGGIIDGDNVVITGSWSYQSFAVETFDVVYEWTGAPGSAVLPEPDLDLPYGAPHTVDTTYTSSTTIPGSDGNVYGVYIFSGWDKSGTLTVTSDITIRGSWTFVATESTLGNAELTKVDADDNETTIRGVTFELRTERGQLVGAYTTGANGKIFVEDLEEGSYYWIEIRAAEGYILSDNKCEFAVVRGETTSVVIENTKIEVPEEEVKPEEPDDTDKPDVFVDDHYAYIIGYDDGLVHPEGNITRAEVATIFFRLLDEATRSKYLTRTNNFTDVEKGAWYNTAVSTMAAMGIVKGRPDGSFDPDANITRAEFAAIAARFDKDGNTTNYSFADIYGHWAEKEISIAANNGWVVGYEDGTFRPDRLITRAEAMTLINRVLERVPESPEDLLPNMITWPDNMDTKAWYYLAVQEATNSHYYKRKENGYEYWIELRDIPDWEKYEN